MSDREVIVRGWMFGVLALLSSPVMAQQPVAEIPFESIPDPLKFPADLYLGEATGVAVNSQKHASAAGAAVPYDCWQIRNLWRIWHGKSRAEIVPKSDAKLCASLIEGSGS